MAGPLLEEESIGRRFGQHFAADPRLVGAIVGAAAPAGADLLEIGAGRGVLTRALAAAGAARVVAVEVDERLLPALRAAVAGLPVEVVCADFLALSAEDLRAPAEGFVVAANLPYAISTPALFRLLDGAIPWRRAVLTIQREVAERLVAPPGRKTYGALSVAAQAAARVEVVGRFGPRAFRPRPRVDSAVVRLEPLGRAYDRRALREVLRRAFSRRRKVLANAFPRATLEAAGIDPRARPEQVPVEAWINLAATLRGPRGGEG